MQCRANEALLTKKHLCVHRFLNLKGVKKVDYATYLKQAHDIQNIEMVCTQTIPQTIPHSIPHRHNKIRPNQSRLIPVRHDLSRPSLTHPSRPTSTHPTLPVSHPIPTHPIPSPPLSCPRPTHPIPSPPLSRPAPLIRTRIWPQATANTTVYPRYLSALEEYWRDFLKRTQVRTHCENSLTPKPQCLDPVRPNAFHTKPHRPKPHHASLPEITPSHVSRPLRRSR